MKVENKSSQKLLENPRDKAEKFGKMLIYEMSVLEDATPVSLAALDDSTSNSCVTYYSLPIHDL